MADISQITLPNGSIYNLKDSTARYEAYLQWGGRNLSASYAPIDAAMIPQLGANRFAFLKPTGVEIQYSKDNGSTWIDYEATDDQKIGIFSTSSNLFLGKGTSKTENNVNNQLRITITTNVAQIYTTLNKIAIYMTTNGNTVDVKIEKATQGNPTAYTTHLDWTSIAGWSGWNILNIQSLTTYGNTSSQFQKVRFIFRQTAINANYPSADILSIYCFGGVGWTAPSTLAKTGILYSYDNSQNATFPAAITAINFVGKINGYTVSKDVPSDAVFTDTKNTAGSTDSNSKLFLIGATTQAANPQTYSHDTVYVGTDGCLYSNSQKVFTAAGGTINGTVSVDNAFSANSAEIGNVVVTGDATFTNDLRGNLIGTVNGSTPIKGGTNAASSVSITPSTATIYSMTSAGSVTAGTATTPAKIDTSKFSGGSFTRGTFTAGSLTMAMDTTDTKKLNITFTAPTHAADSFTAASLASGFYTAGTKGTPTVVTLPTRSSATTVWTGYSAATAAAQTFTGTPC